METFFGRHKKEIFYGYEKDYCSFNEFSEAVRKNTDYYNNERIQAKNKMDAICKMLGAAIG